MESYRTESGQTCQGRWLRSGKDIPTNVARRVSSTRRNILEVDYDWLLPKIISAFTFLLDISASLMARYPLSASSRRCLAGGLHRQLGRMDESLSLQCVEMGGMLARDSKVEIPRY